MLLLLAEAQGAPSVFFPRLLECTHKCLTVISFFFLHFFWADCSLFMFFLGIHIQVSLEKSNTTMPSQSSVVLKRSTMAATTCCLLLVCLVAGQLLAMAEAKENAHHHQKLLAAAPTPSSPAGLPTDPKLISPCAFCYAYSCPSDCKGICGCH